MQDYNILKNNIVDWIQKWFAVNGDDSNAVIGISGGKDSAVVAALCVEALGADRVIGVLMPNLKQDDMDYGIQLIKHLGIKAYLLPISMAVADVLNQMEFAGIVPSHQSSVELPARIRMATLYAVAQSLNGKVANTTNRSKNYVGRIVRYGDAAGDFCPIRHITSLEVTKIGMELGLPSMFVNRKSHNGLASTSDEEELGFSYKDLDQFLITGNHTNTIAEDRISLAHQQNRYKFAMPDTYYPSAFGYV